MYENIQIAMAIGAKLHGFRSGGGLRVIRVEMSGRLIGYGEHPSADEALRHADEDVLAGGRPYKEVYGGKYEHYLTGSSEVTSALDAVLLRGGTCDAWAEFGLVVFEATFTEEVKFPEDVLRDVYAGATRRWSDGEGYEFEFTPMRFPNGEMGAQVTTLKRPDGADSFNDTYRKRTRRGLGKTFAEALLAAFE